MLIRGSWKGGGGYKSHFSSPNYAQIIVFPNFKNPSPSFIVFLSVIPIPSDQIPVPVTQIPLSQWKFAQIPVPILPLQDPLIKIRYPTTDMFMISLV